MMVSLLTSNDIITWTI